MQESNVKIALADDHPLVRHGIRLMLEAEPGFRVVAEATDGLEAAEMTEHHRPDVLVLDLIMPGLSGQDVIRRVVRRVPETRIVVLSMHTGLAHVYDALKGGAAAYVLKGGEPGQLVRAIRDVLAGHRYLAPPLSETEIEAYTRRAASDLYETLTGREREVLQLAADGLSSTAIAERLTISPRTAETHRANVMRKLGLRNRTDLIRFALSRGMLSIEPSPLATANPRSTTKSYSGH